MPVVTEDLRSGHVLSDEQATAEVIRTFRVTELTQPPELQLMEAITTPGIPLLGNVYPMSATPEYPFYAALFVVGRRANPDGCNAARVTITYGNQRRFGRFSRLDDQQQTSQDIKVVSTSVVQVDVTRDSAGAEMRIPPPAGRTAWGYYTAKAKIDLPVTNIVFTRTEDAPPTAEARSYIGRLNSATLGSGLYDVRTVKCLNIEADQKDGGREYEVTYTFQYDSTLGGDLWRHRDTYRNPTTGQPIDGAAETKFDVLQAADFNTLGLDWTDNQTPS